MSNVEFKLLHALAGVEVTLTDATCSKCGSHQLIKDTSDCFGCYLERNVGLRFKEICDQAFASFQNGNGFRMLDLAELHHQRRVGIQQRRAATGQFFYGEACNTCGANLKATVNGECESCGALDFRFSFSRGEPKPLSLHRCRRILRGGVVPVMSMKVDRIIRSVAKELAVPFYHGYPCECGSDKRYTNRGKCVSCVDAQNSKYRKVKGMKPRKNKTPAEARVNEFDRLFE